MSNPLQPGTLDCETIFLDAGGVLVWPNWWRMAGVLRTHGIDVAADALAAADPQVRKQLDSSQELTVLADQKRGSRYFELLLDRAGVDAPLSRAAESALSSLREYHATENLWEYVPDFVPPALAELRRQGLRLVVVSNANGTLLRAFTRLGLAPLVDVILDSAEFGVEKPDPRLFDTALDRSGARRATTVHVGDLYTIDVAGARNAGLGAVLVDQADLYPAIDCPRIRSIAELPRLIRPR
jgi:HAD superfamily hydrolase (TIGR01549 family)